MFLFIKLTLFGDDESEKLGSAMALMNLALLDGKMKITGQSRLIVEGGRCMNERDGFPILDNLNMELEWDMNSEDIVKFTFSSGDPYSENFKEQCSPDIYGKWEAVVPRAKYMQMELSSWVADIADYISFGYKVVN